MIFDIEKILIVHSTRILIAHLHNATHQRNNNSFFDPIVDAFAPDVSLIGELPVRLG